MDWQRKNGDRKMSSQTKFVYAALLYNSGAGPGILGLYYSEKNAIERCFKESTLTRQDWIPEGNNNCWSNGCGRYVKVKKYLVE